MRLRIAEVAWAKKSWNMRQVAEKLDVEHQTVMYWNQGRAIPRLPMLLKLCKVLGCQVEDLVDKDLLDAL